MRLPNYHAPTKDGCYACAGGSRGDESPCPGKYWAVAEDYDEDRSDEHEDENKEHEDEEWGVADPECEDEEEGQEGDDDQTTRRMMNILKHSNVEGRLMGTQSRSPELRGIIISQAGNKRNRQAKVKKERARRQTRNLWKRRRMFTSRVRTGRTLPFVQLNVYRHSWHSIRNPSDRFRPVAFAVLPLLKCKLIEHAAL